MTSAAEPWPRTEQDVTFFEWRMGQLLQCTYDAADGRFGGVDVAGGGGEEWKGSGVRE